MYSMAIHHQLISEFFYIYETNRYNCPDYAFERFFDQFSEDDFLSICKTIITNSHLNDPITFGDSLNWISHNLPISDIFFQKLLEIEEINQSQFFAKIIRHNKLSIESFDYIIQNQDFFFNSCHFALAGNPHCPKHILYKIIRLYENQKNQTIYRFLNSIILSPKLSDEEAFLIIKKYPIIVHYHSLFKREWDTDILWQLETMIPQKHWMNECLKGQKNYANTASAILKKMNNN